MGRRRKSGPRTKSGRLSRVGQQPDRGTREMQAKRAYLIDGADPQLAASASGILLANRCLTSQQHQVKLTYAWAHAMTFGKPWRQACPLGDRTGRETPEDLLLRARGRLAEMDARLTASQRLAVANLSVFGYLPGWFYVARLKLRTLPDDRQDYVDLISGLNALAREK